MRVVFIGFKEFLIQRVVAEFILQLLQLLYYRLLRMLKLKLILLMLEWKFLELLVLVDSMLIRHLLLLG